MIEVLVTIVIIVIGLLGMMQMQSRLQKSEVESYQRTQALMLLNDMVNRISSNRSFADDYATNTPLGTGVTRGDPTASGLAVASIDRAEWCLALQGAAETEASTANVGAMIGARGCVKAIPPDYLVTVVWQGLTPISKPPGTQIDCGQGHYDQPAGSDCAEVGNEDKCRRYVATIVRIADLTPP